MKGMRVLVLLASLFAVSGCQIGIGWDAPGFLVSGWTIDDAGSPLDGVSLSFGEYGSVTSDKYGNWMARIPKAVAATPKRSGYKFTPQSAMLSPEKTSATFTGHKVQPQEMFFKLTDTSIETSLSGDTGSWSWKYTWKAGIHNYSDKTKRVRLVVEYVPLPADKEPTLRTYESQTINPWTVTKLMTGSYTFPYKVNEVIVIVQELQNDQWNEITREAVEPTD